MFKYLFYGDNILIYFIHMIPFSFFSTIDIKYKRSHILKWNTSNTPSWLLTFRFIPNKCSLLKSLTTKFKFISFEIQVSHRNTIPYDLRQLIKFSSSNFRFSQFTFNDATLRAARDASTGHPYAPQCSVYRGVRWCTGPARICP